MITQILNVDELQKILSYAETPNEYGKNGLVCNKFSEANEKIRYQKAKEFCENKTSSQELVKHEKDGIVYYHSVTNYNILPNGRLHGISTKRTYIRKRYKAFTDPPIVEKQLFMWGSFIKNITDDEEQEY